MVSKPRVLSPIPPVVSPSLLEEEKEGPHPSRFVRPPSGSKVGSRAGSTGVTISGPESMAGGSCGAVPTLKALEEGGGGGGVDEKSTSAEDTEETRGSSESIVKE